MKLRFTPRATQDLAGIADYIREHSPRAAFRVRSAILESLRNLVAFPHRGQRQQVEGVRKVVTRRYPYLVSTLSIMRLTRWSFSRSGIPRKSANIQTGDVRDRCLKFPDTPPAPACCWQARRWCRA